MIEVPDWLMEWAPAAVVGILCTILVLVVHASTFTLPEDEE